MHQSMSPTEMEKARFILFDNISNRNREEKMQKLNRNSKWQMATAMAMATTITIHRTERLYLACANSNCFQLSPIMEDPFYDNCKLPPCYPLRSLSLILFFLMILVS